MNNGQGWRTKAAKLLAPGLMSQGEVEQMVDAAVQKALQSRPAMVSYDPKGEGFRPVGVSGNSLDTNRRDLRYIDHNLMHELAYYLHKSSGLVRRFTADSIDFCLDGQVMYSVSEEEDRDGAAQKLLEEFWTCSTNDLDENLEGMVEFLSLLGEQCWGAKCNKAGIVHLSCYDPINIHEVQTLNGYAQVRAAVVPVGRCGTGKGAAMPIIREELNPYKREYKKLVGECFFWRINAAPNEPRGYSDLLHLFELIEKFEKGVSEELDRLKDIKAYVWDVLLKGYSPDEIKAWLAEQTDPQPGSIRAHNEDAEWKAVSPTLNAADNRALFEFIRSFFAATINRPDSWYGGGGKAYQNEADLMGTPTFKALGRRQRYVRGMILKMLRFALDQAVICGVLPDHPYKINVDMPEVNDRSLIQIINALTRLAAALAAAEESGYVTKTTAARLFLSTARELGVDINVAKEIEEAAQAAKNSESGDYPDYSKRTA